MGKDGEQTFSVDLGARLDQRLIEGASEVEKLLVRRQIAPAFEKAKVLYQRFPDKGRVRVIYGLAASLTGHQAEADKMLEFIATLPAEETAAIYVYWADMLFENKNTDMAWDLCARAIDSGAANQEQLRRCADIAMATRDPERLIAVLDYWQEHFPEDNNINLFRAGLSLRIGRIDEAEALARRALQSAQSFGAAFGMLANMDSHLITKVDFEEAQDFRESGSGTDLDRAFIGFARGKILERDGEYDSAFAEYVEGNTALRLHLDKTGKTYSEASQAAFHKLVTKHTGLFPWDQTNGEKGSNSPRPIFIVGVPSSGTSLMEQILSVHEKVRACGERTTMDMVMQPLLRARKQGHWQDRIPEHERQKLREIYLAGIKDEIAGYEAFTDKMPTNFQAIGLISEIFPEAKILLMKRNPLDNCLSIYTRPFNIGFYSSTDLAWTGAFYRLSSSLMENWQERFEDKILEVSYEEITENLEDVCREVLDYCELPWDQNCLEFHESKHPVFTLSASEVRKPIFKSSVGRWRNFEKYLGPLKKALES